MSSQVLKKPIRTPKQKAVLPKKHEEESALLILLKKYSLQQYFKVLADRGFDQNLKGLIALNDIELNHLLDSIKFFPGHRSKFVGILSLLRKHPTNEVPKRRRSTSQRSNSKEPVIRPVSCKNKMSNSRPNFKKLLVEYADLDSNTRSETDRSDMAIELEEAYRKIKELTIQLENRSPSPEKTRCFDPFEPLPSVSNEIKELGMSYDSSRMRSTLHYLDVEEICRCLSKYLRKMIMGNIKANGFPISPGSSRTEATIESAHEEMPLGIQEIFNQQFYDPFSKTGMIPDEDEIYNISKNIIIRSKMEKECSIICLIYIERLKNLTGISPSERNWKRLLFFCLILSSKIWDDESYENQNFADVFSNITLKDINSMEVTFLNLIDFKVGINKSEYAKYYFILRTFADKNHRSFPLVPLDVDTVRKLQSAAHNAESKLREIHQENLYKTL